MMGQTQETIRHADNKVGLLFAASTVLLSAIGAQGDRARQLGLGEGLVASTGVVCFWVGFIVLGVSYVHMVVALVPRVTVPEPHDGVGNRFAWPAVAAMSVEQLLALSVDPIRVRHEALVQAHTLALIASRKFAAFRRALQLAVVAGACLVAFVLLA